MHSQNSQTTKLPRCISLTLAPTRPPASSRSAISSWMGFLLHKHSLENNHPLLLSPLQGNASPEVRGAGRELPTLPAYLCSVNTVLRWKRPTPAPGLPICRVLNNLQPPEILLWFKCHTLNAFLVEPQGHSGLLILNRRSHPHLFCTVYTTLTRPKPRSLS